MPRCNIREKCGQIPHPIMLLFVVSAIFIVTGLNRRGISFLFAGSFSFLLAIGGWIWYKRNGNRFNIKFLDQLSGHRQQTEGHVDDDEMMERRYMNNTVELSTRTGIRSIILMHNPIHNELHAVAMEPAMPPVPPPYSEGPGQAPPYSPTPQDAPGPPAPPPPAPPVPPAGADGANASGITPAQDTDPPPDPPSYDSLFPPADAAAARQESEPLNAQAQTTDSATPPSATDSQRHQDTNEDQPQR